MVSTAYVNMCEQTFQKINTPKIDTHIYILNYLYPTFLFLVSCIFFLKKKYWIEIMQHVHMSITCKYVYLANICCCFNDCCCRHTQGRHLHNKSPCDTYTTNLVVTLTQQISLCRLGFVYNTKDSL